MPAGSSRAPSLRKEHHGLPVLRTLPSPSALSFRAILKSEITNKTHKEKCKNTDTDWTVGWTPDHSLRRPRQSAVPPASAG